MLAIALEGFDLVLGVSTSGNEVLIMSLADYAAEQELTMTLDASREEFGHGKANRVHP